MDLVFITDARFVKASNQMIYSLDSATTNVLWERYLKEFDNLIVMARVLEDSCYVINDGLLAIRDRVTFIELPYYVGPSELIRVYFPLRKKIVNNIIAGRAYICRWGQVASIAYKKLLMKNIPYAVEVIGDPYDVFAPGSFKHPLRPLLRYISYNGLKKNVAKSSAALYVTKYKLQERYPVQNGIFNISASDVVLSKKDFVLAPKTLSKKDSYNMISVGSLAQMYKSPDIVLKAICLLKSQGINVKLVWIGDGKFRKEMIKLSKSLGVDDRVDFVGQIPPQNVRTFLGKSDIFILASRTEGLPRALVEAMSMGLPCIATKVGGIPELLSNDVLISPNNVEELAAQIKKMVENCDFANRQAKSNLERSHDYSSEILERNRICFLQKVKKIVDDSFTVK